MMPEVATDKYDISLALSGLWKPETTRTNRGAFRQVPVLATPPEQRFPSKNASHTISHPVFT